MSEKKRMHPIVIVNFFLKNLKDYLLPIIALLFWKNRRMGEGWDLFFHYLPFAILLFTIFSGLFHWLCFTYRIEEGEIRIEQGWLVRKKRHIPFERIHNIISTQGILQRLFHLEKLKIETAAGLNEAELTAISRKEARIIYQEYRRAKRLGENGGMLAGTNEPGYEPKMERNEQVEPAQVRKMIYSMSEGENFLFALTGGGAIGVLIGTIGLIVELDEWIPFDTVITKIENIVIHSSTLAILLGVAVILFAYLIAVLGTMIKYADFTLEKTERDAVISYGFFEKKRITLPLDRVQGIEIRDNIIRQRFGFASLYIFNAGGSAENKGLGDIIVCPFIKREKIPGIVQSLFPEFDLKVPIRPVPGRARLFYILSPVVGWLIPVGIAFFFLPSPWRYLPLLILPFAGFLGAMGRRYAGWNVKGGQLSLRTRFYNGSTTYLMKNRIQSLEQSRGWLQRRRQLSTVIINIYTGYGGKTIKVRHLDESDVHRIYQWFRRSIPNQEKGNIPNQEKGNESRAFRNFLSEAEDVAEG